MISMDSKRKRVVAVMVVVGWLAMSAEVWGTDHSSWSDWASDKFSEGFGLKDDDENIVSRTGDAAYKATDTINTAVSDSSKYASEKAGEAVNTAYEKASEMASGAKETMSEAVNSASNTASDKAYEAWHMASDKGDYIKNRMADSYGDKASDMKHFATDKVNQGIEMVSDTASDAKDKAYEAWEWASDNKGNYLKDEVPDKGYEAWHHASDKGDYLKDRMADGVEYGHDRDGDAGSNTVRENYEEAKKKMGEAYESAKERVSKATGDLGDSMRTAEL